MGIEGKLKKYAQKFGKPVRSVQLPNGRRVFIIGVDHALGTALFKKERTRLAEAVKEIRRILENMDAHLLFEGPAGMYYVPRDIMYRQGVKKEDMRRSIWHPEERRAVEHFLRLVMDAQPVWWRETVSFWDAVGAVKGKAYAVERFEDITELEHVNALLARAAKLLGREKDVVLIVGAAHVSGVAERISNEQGYVRIHEMVLKPKEKRWALRRVMEGHV